VTSSEFNLQVFLESVHSLQPASLTLEQLARAISAMRFAGPRLTDEYSRREQAVARRREMNEIGEAA
jgi:hypothetical protein